MRVLVVEDEPLIAVDVEQMLLDDGFDVVGLAGTVEQALTLIGAEPVDAVVLDANLGGKSAGPVAEALKARGIPFVAISGYSAAQRPRAFQDAPFVSKPFKPSVLLHAVRGLGAHASSRGG